MWVRSLHQEDPLEKGTATHSSIHVWKIHEQRSLVGYIPWGHKESDMTEATQPTLIKKKKNHVSVMSLFTRTNVLKFSISQHHFVLFFTNKSYNQTFSSSLKAYCKCNF